MKVMTTQKNIGATPRKLRLVADMVRKMKPSAALQTLEFTPKAAAAPLAQAIKTALGNAKQQGVPEENLAFERVEINEGAKYRRFRAGSRGRASSYKKKTSQIRIVLSDESAVVEKGDTNGAKS